MAHAAVAGAGRYALREAMDKARSKESAQFDAISALRDARSLRLQLLRDELSVVVAASPEARENFNIALSPGEPQRLWIDLITSVVMEPDPRTYRLVEDVHGGRVTLFETADRAEMIEQIKQHMAHRIISRERRMAESELFPEVVPGYSAAALIYAWLCGLALGVAGLLSFVIYMKIIDI